VPKGYAPAITGRLFGEFAKGYCRVFTAAPELTTSTYLNEMYVRAVCSIHVTPMMHPTDPKKPVYFVLDGQLVASIMPLGQLTSKCINLADLPDIPFLEDAALYYRASEEDEG
jgi:hypothetical protein